MHKQSAISVLVLTMAAITHAYDIPGGGSDMLTEKFPRGIRFGHREDPGAKHEIVDVTGMNFKKAVRVTSKKRCTRSWGVLLHANTGGRIKTRDVLLVSLWMRTLKSEDESGDGVALVVLERNSAPHKKVVRMKATAGKNWRHCVVPGVALQSLGDGQHQVAIHLGFFPQSIEIGGLRVINYGQKLTIRDMPYMKTTYQGRNPAAQWRTTATERIEKHRKADLTVTVTDAAGNPLPNSEVSIRMQRHAFDFGCVLNTRAFSLTDENGRKYREIFEKYFTKAPTESGFRWQNWIRGSDKQREERKQQLEKSLAWLNEHDIEVRGHYLMWAPVEARNKPIELIDKPDQLLAALWKHAEMKAKWAGKRVQEWDAINHIEGWGTRFADICGGNKVYADMIKKGRKWAPHAEMWVNEGQVLVGTGSRIEPYKKIISDLAAMDARPDGIGFMAHYRDTGLPHPQEVFRRIEEFTGFGCKMQLTEFDVECGPDDQLQADYLRDIMTIAFSHPGIEGIVMWGFWEGRHWRPAAALWREDWSIKPAGETWIDLVRNKWWTNADGKTDENGSLSTRGFLGNYAVQASYGGKQTKKTLSLPATGATLRLVVQ